MKKRTLAALSAAVIGLGSGGLLFSVNAQDEDARDGDEVRERADREEGEREERDDNRERREGKERADDRRARGEREVAEQRERAEHERNIAKEREEFGRRVQNMKREIEKLARDGRPDEAERVERELQTQIERFAREHGRSREGRPPVDARREHLHIALRQIHEAAEHLQAAGFEDQAHELRERAGKLGPHLERELHEAADGDGHRGEHPEAKHGEAKHGEAKHGEAEHNHEHSRQDQLEARVNELTEQMEHVRRTLDKISSRLERD